MTRLRRLEHIRDLLSASGHDAEGATLGLFSIRGFTDELIEEAGRRAGEIVLVGLERLYGLCP